MEPKKYITRHPANALILISLFIGLGYVNKFLLFTNVLNVLVPVAGALLFSSFGRVEFLYSDLPKNNYFSYLKKVFSYQMLFLILTTLFLYAFINHANLSPRLQDIDNNMLDTVLRENSWNLMVLPFVGFTVAGVILSYFFYVRGYAGWLPEVILANAKRQPRLFFFNLFMATYTVASSTILVVSLSVFIALFAEAFCQMNELPSLSSRPLQTSTIALIILGIQKQGIREFFGWLVRHNYSLGKIILFYSILFCTLLLWFHDFLVTAFDFNEAKYLELSYIFGEFSEAELGSRIYCLLLCWLLVWTSWIASYIGKISNGMKAYQVIITNLFLPIAFYTCYMNFHFSIESVFNIFANPQILMVLSVLGFWGIKELYNSVDSYTQYQIGYMPILDRIKKRALIKAAHPISHIAAINFGAFFILGWPVIQVINTAITLFIIIMLLCASFVTYKEYFKKVEYSGANGGI